MYISECIIYFIRAFRDAFSETVGSSIAHEFSLQLEFKIQLSIS